MQWITQFPWFQISISDTSDWDFRDILIHPEIIRSQDQIHKDEIHILEDSSKKSFTDTDWIYTTLSNIDIWGKCADCPIIVLMWLDECAVVHSGWRWTKQHIAQKALSHFSTSLDTIQVFIWPHISKESYIVQKDFLDHFPREYFQKRNWDITFDIESYIIDDLLDIWIPLSNITSYGIDTFTSENYFSYRRDGMIWLGIVAVRRTQ